MDNGEDKWSDRHETKGRDVGFRFVCQRGTAQTLNCNMQDYKPVAA